MAIWISFVKVLLLNSILLTAWWLYGSTHFYRDPGSVFHDQSRAYEQGYSSQRSAEVEQYFNSLKKSPTPFTYDSAKKSAGKGDDPVPICVGMTTTRRKGLDKQYVEDAVLSLVEGLTEYERASIWISLFFVDIDPTEHPTWNQDWLDLLVDDTWSYQGSDGVNEEVKQWAQNLNNTHVSSKSTMDYALTLDRCLNKTDAPLIAIFEGDTLVARGWVARTLNAMKKVFRMPGSSELGRASQEIKEDWLDVRLFNQERSTGWASRKVGANNELMIVVIVDTVLLAVYSLLRHKSPSLRAYTDTAFVAALCMLTIPAVVTVFFQTGKASLLPPRAGLKVENFGCCSQALVFNRAQAAPLAAYLRAGARDEAAGGARVQYDMRTKAFARERRLDRMALYPMQVQHMGRRSASGTAAHEAQALWSMAFEDLDPQRLRLEHERAVRDLVRGV